MKYASPLIFVSFRTVKKTKQFFEKTFSATRGVSLVSSAVAFMLSGACAWAAGSDASAPSFPIANYTTSWLGNSYGGPAWVQRYSGDMHVSRDGTCYLITGWDEGGRECGIYKDGKVIGQAVDTHGWGNGGGCTVTANEKYLFAGLRLGHAGADQTGAVWPPTGTTWFGVGRRKLDGSPAPFPGGKGHGSTPERGGIFLPINAITDAEHADITGLAASGKELFVANPHAGDVEIYDPETMAKTGAWPLPRAGHMTYDPKSNSLWIIQTGEGKAPANICHYAVDGKVIDRKSVV